MGNIKDLLEEHRKQKIFLWLCEYGWIIIGVIAGILYCIIARSVDYEILKR